MATYLLTCTLVFVYLRFKEFYSNIIGFCLGQLQLSMFCLALRRFYGCYLCYYVMLSYVLFQNDVCCLLSWFSTKVWKSGYFSFVERKFFWVFDEVAPPAAPGHISGPRSGGSGLHLHFQSECRFGKYPLTKKIHGSTGFWN